MANPIVRSLIPAGLRRSLRRRRRQGRKEAERRRMAMTSADQATGPDFLIPGVQRGGSTALYLYVVEHPAILPGKFKEIHFFDERFEEGMLWYRRHFPTVDDRQLAKAQVGVAPLSGESSPYYLFHPHAPRRIAESMPEVRSIVILRDPASRAYSHYHHAVSLGYEKLSFEEAIEREPERLDGELERMLADPSYEGFNYRHFSYQARGLYAEQLDRWIGLFPREHVLIVKGEDFFADPAAGLNRAFAFLGLPPFTPAAFPRYNRGKTEPMPAEVERRLREHFAEPNERLYDAHGIDYRS